METIHSLQKMLSVVFGVHTTTRNLLQKGVVRLNSVDADGLSTTQLHNPFGECKPKIYQTVETS